MKRILPFDITKQEIEKFCEKHHIKKLSLFGSALRDDFTSESDVDVLVEFEPGQIIGFFRLSGMEIELSTIIIRKVDLRTPAELSRCFRQEVLDTAEVQYAAGRQHTLSAYAGCCERSDVFCQEQNKIRP